LRKATPISSNSRNPCSKLFDSTPVRLALGVEYDGSVFSGFQTQRDRTTVQESLEHALSQVADQPVRITAAGRTDAGVHATGQVVSFSTEANRPLQAWCLGVNALTPPALKVRWAKSVATEFHPRYDATARRYMYLFYESVQPSPLLESFAVRTSPLDDELMHRAAQVLLGERDFTTFRAAGCQARSPFRCIHRIGVHRTQSLVCLDITANAFLLHMVRNIAGALWHIGRNDGGKDGGDQGWLEEILARRDRNSAPATALPQGLYLVSVNYPGQTFPPSPLPGLLRALGDLDRF